MATKVIKKQSGCTEVPASKRKAWNKLKSQKGWTFFDLLMKSGKSEGTLRTAFKGYATLDTIEAIDRAFELEMEAV